MRDWEEFERKVFREFLKEGFKAKLTSKMGELHGDVETHDLLVECTLRKNSGVLWLWRERINRAIRYAEKRRKIPLLVVGIKETGEKFALLRFDDFMKLYKAYESCKRFSEVFSVIKEIVNEKYRMFKLDTPNISNIKIIYFSVLLLHGVPYEYREGKRISTQVFRGENKGTTFKVEESLTKSSFA